MAADATVREAPAAAWAQAVSPGLAGHGAVVYSAEPVPDAGTASPLAFQRETFLIESI